MNSFINSQALEHSFQGTSDNLNKKTRKSPPNTPYNGILKNY